MTKKEEKLSVAFNKARAKYSLNGQERYTKTEIINMFKETGFPHSPTYFSYCVKHGLIIRHGHSRYAFPTEPIHYTKIAEMSKAAWHSTIKSRSKYITENTSKVIEFDEVAAIKELKKRGYKILKSKVEWEEV